MFCWGNATHHELYIEGHETIDLVSLETNRQNWLHGSFVIKLEHVAISPQFT